MVCDIYQYPWISYNFKLAAFIVDYINVVVEYVITAMKSVKCKLFVHD